ncbi:MAG: serpin family protein [Ruminococcaceae bacterium]|nr:serpin family protein [Oscillospiraceae bacterium]
MKKETLQNAVANLKDSLIDEAAENKKVKKINYNFVKWSSLVAAILVIVMVTVIFTEPMGGSKTPGVLSAQGLKVIEPEYPEMNKYPSETDMGDWENYEAALKAWRNDKAKQKNQYEGYSEGLENYLKATVKEFLKDSGNENKAFSPMNLYFALGMLSEVTEGESRKDILNLLGSNNINSLRKQAKAIWNANYSDDGISTSLLGSSIWIDNSLTVYDTPLNSLKENYLASSYYGDIGSEEVNEALRSWLNEHTGDFLKESVDDLELDEATLLAIASTLYFKDRWDMEFGKGSTEQEIFYASGGEVEADFMKGWEYGKFYVSDNFSAFKKNFLGGGGMWFILPDEDTDLESVLSEDNTLEFIANNGEGTENKEILVNLSIPKFDVKSDLNLNEGLKNLGLSDLFAYGKADFSALTDTGLAVSDVKQSARVKIDEEGVEAAAYTVITADGGALLPEDEVDFVLNRPFIYVITGADGLPLFVGVINNPAK